MDVCHFYNCLYLKAEYFIEEASKLVCVCVCVCVLHCSVP